MFSPNWLPLARHQPVFELPRDDVGGRTETGGRRRDNDDLKGANDLRGAEALALVRTIRSKALRQSMPDSTPMIRADRDGR